MPYPGISRRLRRLEGPGGRFLLLALDHGLPAGPLPGIEDPVALLRALRGAPITGVIANPGLVPRIAPALPTSAGLVVHLSAGTVLGTRPTSKVLGTLPERALALGADAVSVQIHFGDVAEERMLSDAGRVVDAASGLGLPVLGMAHPPATEAAPGTGLAHCVRAIAELGAGIVQTTMPPDPRDLVDAVRGSPVPVIVAGGPRRAAPDDFLDALRAAIRAGASGVAAGRNLFQHPDPPAFARAIGEVVFGG